LSKISLVSLRALIFKNTHSPERLLLVVILIAFLLVQASAFLGSCMSVFSRYPDERYAISYALEIWLPRLIYPLAAALLLVQTGRNFIQRNHFLNIPVAGAVLAVAIQAWFGEISPAIFAAILFVIWINQWMPIPRDVGGDWFNRYVFQALLTYLIAPIALLCLLHLARMIGSLPESFNYLIDRASDVGLFRSESFRGFSRDRIAYSYLCGMALLYLLAIRKISVRTYIWIGLLLIALFMASSRAALIALVVAACFIAASKRSALFFFAGGLAVLVVAAFLSGRTDFVGDPGNRADILFAYLDHIRANPLVPLTGEGRFGTYIQLADGALVRPHSWLLNSIINFGALTTAAWIVFLYKFFQKLNPAARSVHIYFVTMGFFHNGFDAYFFSMEQLLGFLFAMSLGMKTSRPLFRASKDDRGNGAPQLT
jgi:hypothetical protein